MKVSQTFVYTSIICELIIIFFHLQMMSILYFTYSTFCRPKRSSVDIPMLITHIILLYIALILMIIIIVFIMYLLTNVSEYTNAHVH